MSPTRGSRAPVKGGSGGESELDDLIGYNLKRAYVIVQMDFRASLGKDRLAPRTFSALTLVVRFPNITQSELAQRLGIERSGLVAIIDELEGRKYLDRVVVRDDRRVQALVPTQAGRKACKAALAAVRAHEDRLFSVLSASEKEQLLDLLKKIRKSSEETS